MSKKSVSFFVVCLIVLGIFIPQISANASPTQEFYNGEWELCYFSGWFIFQKETCNTFSEGNYILSYEGDLWTLDDWDEQINFRGKMVTIKQKSLLRTLEVNAIDISMTNEPVISGRDNCDYDPYELSMTCSLWGNDKISIVPQEGVYYTIFANEYTTD